MSNSVLLSHFLCERWCFPLGAVELRSSVEAELSWGGTWGPGLAHQQLAHKAAADA